jgi:probable rRNA maturation factor
VTVTGRLEVEVFKAVRVPVPTELVGQVLARAATVAEIAARLPEGKATVAVRIITDREMRRLNRVFADDDHATDVLSFAGGTDHVGDVAISWPAVVRQAAEHGHTESTELALLSVHGLLHLLGWEHTTRRERQEVDRLTLAALKPSGLKPAMRRVWSGYTPAEGLRRSPRA